MGVWLVLETQRQQTWLPTPGQGGMGLTDALSHGKPGSPVHGKAADEYP